MGRGWTARDRLPTVTIVKVTYIMLMVITGMIIPVMASLNGALSLHLKSVPSAVVIFFMVATCLALSLSFYLQGAQTFQLFNHLTQVPRIYLLGGIGVVWYITSVSIIGPKLGIGMSLVCVLLGQLITMTMIDHFALFGMPRISLSIERIIGLLLMLAGIYFVLSPTLKSQNM